MHYAVVCRRAKLTAQHRVIYAIPCKTIKYHVIPQQIPNIQIIKCKTMPCNTMQCNTMQSNRRPYNTCNTKKYHVIPYLSRLKPQLGRWGLFSQAGWFHMGCNSAGWAGFSVVMLWTPHKAIFQTQKISHKNGAMEIWDIWAKMGPSRAPGAQKGPNTRSKWVVTMNPGGPIGGSWDQIWSFKDLRGPRKDLLWPKRALFASFWSFSQTGWFYMDYNSAGWAEHSAAMLWTPHKPIF